jgi:hypothetical protein
LGTQALGLAPLLMLQANIKLDLSFDDYDEVNQMAMLEPFMANFSQLFEGMMGQDIDSILNGDRIEIPEGQELKAQLKWGIEFFHTLFDVCQKMAEQGEMEVNASFPNLASLQASIKSEDLGKAIHLALRSTIYDKAIKPEYEWCISN